MKNQYFGDINDYKKYGLLRIITEVTGEKIGVCWMLTKDDNGKDGKKIHYLKNHKEFRKYDAPLFDQLGKVTEGKNRDIKNVRKWNIIDQAKYFEDEITDILADRKKYFENASEKLKSCKIIFFDPDNGLEVPSVVKGKSKSSKYIYFEELKKIYSKGKTLIIYQHFPREKRDDYLKRRVSELHKNLPAANISSFRTSFVVFFMVSPKKITYNFSNIDNRVHLWKKNNRFLITRNLN